jgi:hypothetical protein
LALLYLLERFFFWTKQLKLKQVDGLLSFDDGVDPAAVGFDFGLNIKAVDILGLST